MPMFEREKLCGFEDSDSAAVFEGYVFNRCEFDDCLVSLATRPELRATIRNCQLIRCVAHQNCTINTSIVEDCVVDGLHTKAGPLFLQGAVFKHVVIRGAIGRVIVGNPIARGGGVDRAFLEANATYYRDVDWALDLTMCDAAELELSMVPGHLVRRDPTSQILVTRERALANDWRGVDTGATAYDIAIERMLDEGRESEVLVAPRRHKSFMMHIAVQKRLRDAGIAEPD